jgi:hypothetical protein
MQTENNPAVNNQSENNHGFDVVALKAQFKDIHLVEVETEGPNGEEIVLAGVFRAPSIKELDLYATLQGSGQPVSGMQIVAKNLIVAGDRRLVDDEQLFLSVMGVLDKLFSVKIAKVKKL